MKTKRKVEVFSPGCPVCYEAIETVKRISCKDCEVIEYFLSTQIFHLRKYWVFSIHNKLIAL